MFRILSSDTMVKVFKGEDFDHPHEREMFFKLRSKIEKIFGDDEAIILANFYCMGKQIDATLLKEDGITVIEMKSHEGVVEGGEEGVWTIDGNKIGDRENANPYIQIRNQKFALLNKLEKNIKKIFGEQKSKDLKDSGALGHITGLVLFNNIIEDRTGSFPKAQKWFHVTDMDGITTVIKSITSKELNIKKVEREKIKELMIGDKTSVSIKENIEKNWELLDEAISKKDKDMAGSVKKNFTRLFDLTGEENDKLSCKHGIALSRKNRSKCLRELLDIFNKSYPQYKGFKDHKILIDIMGEYSNFFRKYSEFEEEIWSIIELLKKTNQIEILKESFFMLKKCSAHSDMYQKIGEYILENDDDIDILKNMFFLHYIFDIIYSDMDDEAMSKWFKKFNIVIAKTEIDEEDVHTILELLTGDMGGKDLEESVAKEIVSTAKKYKIISPAIAYNYLGIYYYNYLEKNWEDLSNEKRKTYFENSLKCFKNHLDNQDNVASLLVLYNTFPKLIDDDLNKKEKLIRDLIDFEDITKRNIKTAINIASSICDEKEDKSLLYEKLIPLANKKYTDDLDVNTLIGQMYQKDNIKERAIYFYKRALGNLPKDEIIFAGTSNYFSNVGINIEENNRFYKMDEEKKDTYKLFDRHGVIAFSNLVNLYINDKKYWKALESCNWLRRQKIDDYEKYTRNVYYKIGKWLMKKYDIISEEYKSKKVQKHVETKVTFDDYIWPNESKLKSKIEYYLENVKEGKPVSLLFHGPPGTGKSFLGEVIAGELEYRIIKINGSDVFDKYVGEGEKKLAKIFKKIQEEPTVLIINEFEQLAFDRIKAERMFEVTIQGELLSRLEEITNENNLPLFIIATTNNINQIDEAIIRRGRFNRKIHIDLPDYKQRKNLFKHYLTKIWDKQLADDLDYGYFAKKSDGFSQVDIVHIVNESIPMTLYEQTGSKEGKITSDIINKAIEEVSNSIRKKGSIPYHR